LCIEWTNGIVAIDVAGHRFKLFPGKNLKFHRSIDTKPNLTRIIIALIGSTRKDTYVAIVKLSRNKLMKFMPRHSSLQDND